MIFIKLFNTNLMLKILVFIYKYRFIKKKIINLILISLKL